MYYWRRIRSIHDAPKIKDSSNLNDFGEIVSRPVPDYGCSPDGWIYPVPDCWIYPDYLETMMLSTSQVLFRGNLEGGYLRSHFGSPAVPTPISYDSYGIAYLRESPL